MNITAQRIIQGSAWLVIVKIYQQLSSFIVNIFLARLLFPEDFGLFAIISVYIAIIQLISNIGFGKSVIWKKDVSHLQLSSIFWLNFITSIFSFLLIFFTSGLAADFYKDLRVILPIKILSINILIAPFYIIQRRQLEKKIDFKTLLKIDVSADTGSSIIAILSALMGAGVYSLIIQSMVQIILYLFFTLYFNRWRPSFAFNWNSIRDMIGFSLKYKGSQLTNYLERNIDYLILGRIYTSNIVGLYTFAYNIMYLPVRRISSLFTDVLFPTFSIIQEEYEKIQKGYLKSIGLISMVAFPVMTFVAVFSTPLIEIIFGHKWIPASKLVSILCIAGAIQSTDEISKSIFDGIGRAEINFYNGVFRSISTGLCIVIGSIYSIEFIAILIMISKFLFFMVSSIIVQITIKLKILKILKQLIKPILNSFFIFLIGYFTFYMNLVQEQSIILMVITFIISLSIGYLFHKTELKYILSLLIKRN